MKEKKTVLLVGGGTGGHIVPILNIYKELKQAHPNLNVITVGGTTKIDKKFYDGLEDHISLTAGKLHRAFNPHNILQFFYLTWGFVESFVVILRFKPKLIFSKAGYVSLPIIFWAKLFKIPYFIHESDIEMGKANKFSFRSALKVFVGFPANNYPREIENKATFIGQILRPEMLNLSTHIFDFGFKDKKPIIFITGGSQGARSINNSILDSLSQLLPKYNLVHHVGSLDYAKAVEIRSKLDDEQKGSYFISDLLTSFKGKDSLLSAITQSDLVISRSSATTLAEVAALQKAIITIPYGYAASNHQVKNALFYQAAKAAIVLNNDELSDKLVSEINHLFDNPDKMKQMAKNAFNLLPRDGLSKVIEEIVKFLETK